MSDLQPLQRLKFATPPVPSKEIGAKGELVWLQLDQLAIDTTYQRHILESGKGNIRRMIEEFSWAKFGTLDVARRGKNRFAVIDGQHRATAALNHGGIDRVPCLVLDRTPAEEARAFAAINGNVTRIHALQSWRAAVAGGDAEAGRISVLCAQAGVAIAPYPKSDAYLAAGETCALGSIRGCFKRHGEEALLTALIILRASDPESALPGLAVRGLCEAAPLHPEWNTDAAKIGERMARGGGHAALIQEAMARRLQRGGALWKNLVEIAERRIASTPPVAPATLKKMMAGR